MEIKTDNYRLSEINSEKEKLIQDLNKRNDSLNKTIKDYVKSEKSLKDIQKVNEQQIMALENEIQKKNDELEERLENVSKLIQKNEQLTHQ